MSKELPSKPVRELTGFKELKSFSVYVNLFSRTKINGITRSVFKIIVEDNISHHKYLGYSFDKSRNSIDIFVSYVLSNIGIKDKLTDSLKVSGGRILQPADLVDYIPRKKKSAVKIIQGNTSHREIILSIYRELIFNNGHADFEGYFESSNPILPPLFVDSFIGDIDKMVRFTDFWRHYSMNKKDIDMHNEALYEVSEEVEGLSNEFDFDRALTLFNRISKAAVRVSGSEKLSAHLLLKRAKIYFHLEEYEKCRKLIEENLKEYEAKKFNDELGEMYYYLGMISSYENKNKQADSYFTRSARLLTYTAEPIKTCIYFLSRIRRFLLKKNFNQAVVLVNKAIRFIAKNCSLKELGYIYSIKAEIFYREGKYRYAIDNIHHQLENAASAKDVTTESKGIAQLFQIYSYWGHIDENKAKDYLRRLKLLSNKIQKRSYYYDSLVNLGVFYYRLGKLEMSEKYFNKAAGYYTPDTKDTASHIVNMIYLAKIKISRKRYLAAVRLLNRLLSLSKETRVTDYDAYIENCLGRIYSETGHFLKSNKHLNKVLKYIEVHKTNDDLLKANTYKLIGLNFNVTGKKKMAGRNLKKAILFYRKLPLENNAWLDATFKEIKSVLNATEH